MPLQWQNTAAPFGRGIDTKSDPKLVAAPFLAALENGVFDSGGSIVKRNGYEALPTKISTGGIIRKGQALATYRGELLLFDGARAYSYSPANAEWIDKGSVASAMPASREVVRNAYSQSDPDMALCGDLACYTWADSRGGIRCSVRDLQSNVLHLADKAVGVGTRAKVVADVNGRYFYIMRQDGQSLAVHRISIRNPTTINAPFFPALDCVGEWDFIAYKSRLVLAYVRANPPEAEGPGTTIRIAYLTPTGQLGAQTNNYPNPYDLFDPGAQTTAVSVSSGASGLVFAVCGLFVNDLGEEFGPFPSNSKMAVYTLRDDFSEIYVEGKVFTNKTVVSVGVHYSDGIIALALQLLSDDGQKEVALAKVLDADFGFGDSIALQLYAGLQLVSRPWVRGDNIYALTRFNSVIQPTYFAINQDGKVLAPHHRNSAGPALSPGVLPSSLTASNGQVLVPVCKQTQLQSENGVLRAQIGLTQLTLDYESSTAFNSCAAGGNLYIAGGQVLLYDGRSLVEDGFTHAPEPGPAVTEASTGSIGPGVRFYKAVFAWTDAHGQVHRSATSRPLKAISPAGLSSTYVSLPGLALTAKSGVIVELYRTKADGTNYFLCTSPTEPKPNSEQVTIKDVLSDVDLESRALLYTSGGELDNDPPPAMRYLIESKGRLFGIPSDDALTVRYTKAYDGSSGMGWSEAFLQRVPAVGGEVETLGALDDKIIALKRNKLFALSGDGPTPNGLQDSFSPFQLINSDCGCTDGDSLVDTSDGLVFKSAKGIRLLDRSLGVQDIGGPVTAYNANDVSSAVLLEDVNQVRFTCSDGPALCYDLYWKAPFSGTAVGVGQWSTFTGHAAMDAVLWKSAAQEIDNTPATYCYLRFDGRVYVEANGVYQDNGVSYPLAVETAWFPFAGNQGYFRCRRAMLLGTYFSPHILRVQVAYNYRDLSQALNWSTDVGITIDSYGDNPTYGSDSVYGGKTDNVYQVRIDCRPQKCQAIKFRFTDTPLLPVTAGKAYSLSGLAFEIGMKKGLHKTDTTKLARA